MPIPTAIHTLKPTIKTLAASKKLRRTTIPINLSFEQHIPKTNGYYIYRRSSRHKIPTKWRWVKIYAKRNGDRFYQFLDGSRAAPISELKGEFSVRPFTFS